MKKLTLLTTLLLCFCNASLYAQRIIRVDNNTNAIADFNNLQDAIDDANTKDGDTLFIMGSPESYIGNSSNTQTFIRVNKRLNLIGPGYSHTLNGINYYNRVPATLSLILGEGADGSIVMGLNIVSISIRNTNRDGDVGNSKPENIIIKRNYITGFSAVETRNLTVIQNAIETPGAVPTFDLRESSSIVIRNNIIDKLNWALNNRASNIVFENNIVFNNSTHSMGSVYSTTLRNNIFYDCVFFSVANSELSNNLFYISDQFRDPYTATDGSVISNNVFDVDPTKIFKVESLNSVTNNIIDNEFQLASDSPAKGIGLNGVDAGAFGGDAPYILSGIPPIPTIYDIQTTGVGSKQEGINVTIKIRSNN